MISKIWKSPILYVVARFLNIMYNNGRHEKDDIQMLLGLNYPRFIEYLEWLSEHELVAEKLEEEEKTERIILTPRGMDSYHKLVDWIKETMDGVRI